MYIKKSSLAVLTVVVVMVLLGLFATVVKSDVAADGSAYSSDAVEIDPLTLNAQYTAYFNDLPNSPTVCVSIVHNDMAANSTVKCVEAPFPSNAKIQSTRGLGQYHEEYVIMIYPLGSQLVVILPKDNVNPAIGPSSDG